MSTALHRLRAWSWLAPVAILALAAVLRLWALDRPGALVFDELYYVRDAMSQLAHGFPTGWPDDDPAFGGERARSFTDEASSVAHPPLGKWLIGLGLLLFGPDTGWGWRISAAVTGIATVGLTMRLGWLMGRSLLLACLAGLLLALDGVHIVLSRVSLLDIFLTFFVVLGALFVWHDQQGDRGALWRRPWLFAAGLAFGAAASVKWSGLYPLAAFLLLITLRDLLRLLRGRGSARPVLRAFTRALAAAAIALPAAFASYLASWIGWIVTAQARGPEPWWEALIGWHTNMLGWHAVLDAPHPFGSHPLTWPLALRPTAMYVLHQDGVVVAVTPIPNPLVIWGGVAALLMLAWVLLRATRIAVRRRSLDPLRGGAIWASAFVLTGYLSGWLPWVLLFSRSAVFQFYAVVLTPFAALALAMVLAGLASPSRTGDLLLRAGLRLDDSPQALLGRRIAVAIVLIAALVLALVFWPVWSGMPIGEWFWRLHLWLPGWT